MKCVRMCLVSVWLVSTNRSPPLTPVIICQHALDHVSNQPSSLFHLLTISSRTPLWLCMQKSTRLFIALSRILQAAKDILYWKGNTSSLQTVSIGQYGLCTDIESSAGCYVTVPDRPNLFLWFESIDGNHRSSIESSFLPDWKTNQTPRRALPLFFICDILVISNHPTPVWILFSVSRSGSVSGWNIIAKIRPFPLNLNAEYIYKNSKSSNCAFIF